MSDLKTLYKDACQLVESKGFPFDAVDVDILDIDSMQREFLRLQSHMYKVAMKNTSSGGAPNGNWYMLTTTSLPSQTIDIVLENHQKVLKYFLHKNIDVFYAALEQSSIYHVHYIIRMYHYAKNEGRDISKIIGVRTRLEKKVRNLKQFNGLCKYVLKREYIAEKASTQVRPLVDCIKYEEGMGYVLCDKECTHHMSKIT